jgi:histidine triad (HIT) family protein
MSAEHCLFCAIAAGSVPAAMVAADAATLAVMDLRQGVPGHVLVIPRRHAENLYELDDDDAGAVMRMARRVGLALRAAFAPAGLNLWQSNGRAAGQEVFHFHLHVQPRRVGDGLLRVYPQGVPPASSAADLATLAATVRQYVDRAASA